MKAALCLVVLAAATALALGAPNLPVGLVRTPSGVFPAECVHSIPSGATMERNPATERLHVHLADGTLHAILPKCEQGSRVSLPSDYDGWEAYVSYELSNFAIFYWPKPYESLSFVLTHLKHAIAFTRSDIVSSATLPTTTPKTRHSTLFSGISPYRTSRRKLLM
jgi:hypothetical protein